MQVEPMVCIEPDASWDAAIDGVIAGTPLFCSLGADAAAALRASMSAEHLKRGQTLFREGDAGDRLYVIAEGKITLGRRARDGRESLLVLMGPGEMFGELSLFDRGPRTSTATARTHARVLSLSHDRLAPWLDQYPQVALSLLGQLARRCRRAHAIQSDLVFADAAGRVAKALLDLSDRFGVPTADGRRVEHDLTQGEIAHLVGASRETVNKALGTFSARGWLRTEGRVAVLLDVASLAQRAR